MPNDIAALGLSVDSSPVAKATSELQDFAQSAKTAETAATGLGQGTAQAGVATQAMAQNVNRAVAQAQALNRTLAANARQAGLSGYALTNLGYQINDVATQALSGVGAFQILAQQGGQVYQILASANGGVGGALSDLSARLAAIVTPARLAGGTLATAFVTAAVAAKQYADAQEQIRLGLIGMGSAAGITEAAVRAISLSVAQAGKATVTDAQQVVLALASTGKITEDVAKQAAMAAAGLGRIFGENTAEAGARLAKALADPARGVDDLNARLAVWDNRQADLTRTLAASGQTLGAQQIIMQGVTARVQQAEQVTTGWAAAWLKAKAAASEYWDAVSRGTARMAGLGTAEEQLADALKNLADAERLAYSPGNDPGTFNMAKADAIARYRAEVERLTAAIKRTKDEAESTAAGVFSEKIGAIVRSVVPDDSTRIGLEAQVKELETLLSQLKDLNRLAPAVGANLGKALEMMKQKADAFLGSFDVSRLEHEFAMLNIAARSPAERGQIAYNQTREQQLRSGRTNDEATAMGEMRRAEILKQASIDLLRNQQAQLLTAQQNVDVSRMELGLVGANAETQERIRAQTQLRQQAEQEALRLYGDKDAYDKRHLEALQGEAAKQAEINALVRQRTLLQDIQFERAQLGRTTQEQEVYSRLKSAGMLTNGEIKGTAAEAAAAQIRLNYTLRQSIDMSREFASSFVQDMLQGKSATEALANSLNKLASKLADLAVDNVFAAIFGGAGGTGALGGLLGGGIKAGGAAQVPTFHSGGIVGVNDNNPPRIVAPAAFAGARRYHTGGIAGLMPGEVPAILQRGEVVLPVSGAGRGMGGVINAPVTIAIDARGAEQASVTKLIAAVADLKAELPRTIVKTVQQAQDRRVV
ncbi:MAG: phage tail length tape measure family protein [Hyphomicrobiaceae bacterium]|nr:phage tail length tape measure family protein [Hyphomicrobiaceae bacterium]